MRFLNWKLLGVFVVGSIVLTTSLSAGIGYQRRQTYLALSQHHLAEMAANESVSRSDGHLADMYEGKAPREQILAFLMPIENTNALRANQELYAQKARHHAALSHKYQEAAAHPWDSITPDPPSP